MSIIGIRQVEVSKLYKNTRLVLRPINIESVIVDAGATTLVSGTDYRLTPEGTVEILNDAVLEKDALITYNR
jgi:hypothetical protein